MVFSVMDEPTPAAQLNASLTLLHQAVAFSCRESGDDESGGGGYDVQEGAGIEEEAGAPERVWAVSKGKSEGRRPNGEKGKHPTTNIQPPTSNDRQSLIVR